jgi:hypothetical protein
LVEANRFIPRWSDDVLRDGSGRTVAWTERWNARQLALQLAIIVAGAGLYGAAMGWWRAPEQGLYTAIKLPAIVLLTATGNALLNAMLAPLLGLNLPFRQSFLAILTSFAIASAILGSFSPLTAFLVWNAPPLSSGKVGGTYSFILVLHVAIIAFAGVAANLRLRNLLLRLGGSARTANRVLLAWLAGNLFLGSQLSWILRPFIGAPGLELQFLRDHPLEGNFYEAVFRALTSLLRPG